MELTKVERPFRLVGTLADSNKKLTLLMGSRSLKDPECYSIVCDPNFLGTGLMFDRQDIIAARDFFDGIVKEMDGLE